MKAGLFLCDHVHPDYQAKFGDYSDMYTHFLKELDIRYYDVCQGQFPTDLAECDVYIATGSRWSVYDNLDWIQELKKTVRAIYEQHKFFIGCCFGHQLLAEALGGKVEKSSNGWCVGVHSFQIQSAKDWMQPMQSTYNVLMLCQDQVQILPPHAEVLASNADCPVGLYQVGERMLGIQAHPEFSKAYDQLLIEKRVNRIGAPKVEEAIASMTAPIHPDLIHQWMMNFLGVQHF